MYLAHHAGEQALAPLLLLAGGGGLWILTAVARAYLAAVWARLAQRNRLPLR